MLFAVLASFVALVTAKNELYMGYKVYNVKLTNQEQQDNFHRLKSDVIDYWTKPNVKYGIVGKAMLPPSQFSWFEDRLEELGVERDIAIEDVFEYLLEMESKRVKRIDDATDTDSVENYYYRNETQYIGEVDHIKETGENNNTTENIETNESDGNKTNENKKMDEVDEKRETEQTKTSENTDEVDEIHEIEEITERVFNYDDYYRYSEILDHIYRLKAVFEDSTTIAVDVVEFGTTDFDRPLVHIKISNKNTEVTKPIIVIEGGVNPREWITISSALNIVDKILEDNHSRYLDSFDWIVIPVVNPDGYEYTHTDLRLWEKNFSNRSNFGFICPGVNINRNFDIDWSHSDSSSSPCSHLYAGDGASSEKETRLVQTIIETYKEQISLYISLQSGGGFVSYPWQYEFAASGMFRQNHLLGMEMVAAMQGDYSLDVSSVALGQRTSGTSADYARIKGVLYAFNINIVSRGIDGIIVPENEIVDAVEDIWRAVSVAADYLIQ